MYNKKSRISAILALATAALFVGLILVFRFSEMDFGENNIGAAFFLFIFGGYGITLFYAGSILAAVIAFFCGLTMLLGKTQRRLISANKSLMILGIVLLPIVALGLTYIGYLYAMTVDGLLRVIYVAVAGVAYLGCIVVSIVTKRILKNMPESGPEPAPAPEPANATAGETEE